MTRSPRDPPIPGPDPRQALGAGAERIAERHLLRLGWRILARRWRCRFGELDLVALDGATVVFVEVRCRSGLAHGRPEETVRPLKQRRLARVASLWLATNDPRATAACRFDVIAVAPGPDGALVLSQFRDAFRAR